MSDSKKVLAEILKNARKEKGLTQKEVCQQSGVVLRSYQRIEGGELSPKLETLAAITKALGGKFLQHYTSYLEGQKKDPQAFLKLDKPVDLKNNVGEICELPMVMDAKEIEGIKRCFESDLSKDLAGVGYWEWNITQDKIYCSDQMFHIYEMDPNVKDFMESFRSGTSIKDVQELEKDIANLVERGIPYINIHNYQVRGQSFKVRAQGRRYHNQAGEVIVFGICERIS